MALWPSREFIPSSDPFTRSGLAQDCASAMRQMDRVMQQQMGDMSSMVNQMMPLDVCCRQAEAYHMNNPVVTDNDGNRKLQLQFDVRQFKPEEIRVKTDDNKLEVHARHEESDNNTQVYREYHRSYMLPRELNPANLRSTLDQDGVLTLEAPLPALPPAAREENIPIEHVKK